MLRAALCAVAGHSIDRHRVWHDGTSFRTRCQTCSQPMIRDRNGWRKFVLEVDAKDNRAPHPVTGEVA